MAGYISIQDYTYDLPEDRIAFQPLGERDESKLLLYTGGQISHHFFNNVPDLLPERSLLVFNDTRVIPARIHFQKESGAEIEIFLLNPAGSESLLMLAMLAKNHCRWKCTIGNLKRWKAGQLLSKQVGSDTLTASLADRSESIVEFTWTGDRTFSEIISEAGITPLPPYIKRAAAKDDLTRYQTIYSHHEGAVAAPTAGLHFTQRVFEALRKKGIEHDFLTLHVSAGTFQPIKADNVLDHTMHFEQVSISRQVIERLADSHKIIIAVGTTSMRTLESLYWYGVKLMANAGADFNITQHDPYQLPGAATSAQALTAVLKAMERKGIENLSGTTSIFIYPGYRFRICRGLITNFHQPGSTLMLLVAAFIGKHWKEVYQEALKNEYRFLSYGDSSLLLP